MDAHALECLDFGRIRDLLAGYAMTGLGRGLAAAIRPVARPERIHRWLAQFRELQRLESQRGLPPLGGISDVRELVHRCAPPLRVTVEDIARIGSTLAGTHAVARYLADLPEDCPELRHLAERIGDFHTIAGRIAAVVDERGQVRDDASPKLARIRGEIQRVAAQIREVVGRLLHDPQVRRLLQYANHTFHGDRMVLPVKMEYRGRLPGIIHRSSDSGATIYVEPAEAVELNNQISNLRGEEAEEINRLLWDLAHEVYINAQAIVRTLDTLAVLDLVIAKVRFARDYDLRCPEVCEEPVLSVRQARHPLLLELARRHAARGEPGEPVVPISFRLGEDFDLLIITGPNTGGKTVTLKTIGLLTLMLQAGVPVPVGDGSRMGLFRDVLIDVGDEQSMQQSLSTFSAHLRRQMEMLQKAGPHTLLLIDELGAGTDPDEGAAIGQAILDELLACRCRCVATTHIGALKSFPLTRPRAENACVEFDVETLRPTYHLRIGEPGASNALAIAQRLGMPRRLIAAARRNLSGRARAFQAAMEGTAAAKRQAEQARAAAEDARITAEKARGDARAARAALEQQAAEFRAWIQRVVHLQPGDPVRVRGFDRDGRIVRVRLDQQRAEVDVGSFAVEVPLGDVLPPQTPAPPPRAPRPPRTAAAASGPAAAPEPASVARARVDEHRKGPPPPRREPSAPARRDSARDGAREPRAHPPVPSLTDEQAAALQPGDRVYAKRFHREGTVVRVTPAKRLAVVSVGLLEVELPFDGLGAARKSQAREPGPRHRPSRGDGDKSADSPAAEAAENVELAPAAGDAGVRPACASPSLEAVVGLGDGPAGDARARLDPGTAADPAPDGPPTRE